MSPRFRENEACGDSGFVVTKGGGGREPNSGKGSRLVKPGGFNDEGYVIKGGGGEVGDDEYVRAWGG